MSGDDSTPRDTVSRAEALPILARLAEQARQSRSQRLQHVLLQASCEIAKLVLECESRRA